MRVVSFRSTNQIALFPFVCCFCFIRAFSFQGHTKIALSLHSVPYSFRSYSLSFTVYCSSFHSLLFLTVIPLVSIPFTVYFIPIFSILFTVYFQFNFIPFHFTVHYLLNPFPFRSLLSWFHSVNSLPHIHCLFISVPVPFRFNNCHLSFISIKFHSSLWCF